MSEKQNNAPIVLVVDDFIVIRKMLRIWLEKHLLQVFEAEDGDEAIRIAAEIRPSLILMDIGLPNRSGISATYQLRKLPGLQEVPIIAITAYETPELHEDALKAGCLACLTKPVDEGRLENLLRELGLTDG